jgi:hypothetical protein
LTKGLAFIVVGMIENLLFINSFTKLLACFISFIAATDKFSFAFWLVECKLTNSLFLSANLPFAMGLPNFLHTLHPSIKLIRSFYSLLSIEDEETRL